MDMLAGQIVAMFGSFNKETLDLHTLFKAGGNDFYALTREGRVSVRLDHTD